MFVDEQTWAQKSACRRKVEAPIEDFLVHDIPSTFIQQSAQLMTATNHHFNGNLRILKWRYCTIYALT